MEEFTYEAIRVKSTEKELKIPSYMLESGHNLMAI